MEATSKGFPEAANYFAGLAERTSNLKPQLESFGAYIVKVTDDGFRGEREADGTAFVPLAASTIDARIRSASTSLR